MPDSAVTFTPVNSLVCGNTYRVTGSLAVGAAPGTYTAGGIAMSFLQSGVKATRVPLWVDIAGQAGYEYCYVPGTNASDGKLKILTTAGTEVTAGAMPAAISGDTIACRAEFKGMM